MVNEPAVLIANLMALVVVYAYARKQGGMLKIFPVWATRLWWQRVRCFPIPWAIAPLISPPPGWTRP